VTHRYRRENRLPSHVSDSVADCKALNTWQPNRFYQLLLFRGKRWTRTSFPFNPR